MRQAFGNRVGPATGLLFFVLLMGGAAFHGYPDIRPSDSQLTSWLATVDPNRFTAGVYIEAVGILLFIPFAAWLYGRVRQGARDVSWPAVAMLAAGAGWVVSSLPLLGAWAGLVDQARKGLDVRVAQTLVSIIQVSYDLTAIVLGLTLLAAGVAIVLGGTMSRWAGWAAIVIGAIYVATLPFGPDATPAGLLGYLWLFAVAGYYTVRPGRPRKLDPGVSQASLARGLPTGS